MPLINQMGLGVVLSYRDRMTRSVDASRNAVTKLRREVDKTGEEVAKQSEKMFKSMERYRRGMTASLKVAAAGVIIAAPFILATREAEKMQDSMQDVASVLRGTGLSAEVTKTEIKKLKESILNVASETRIPLSEMNEAVFALISALGIEIGAGALEATAKAAIAGKGTIQEAVGSMTVLLDTYGEAWGNTLTPMQKSDKIGNQLSATVAAFNTDLTKLSEALKQSIPAAISLNIPLEDLLATLGTFQTKGIQSSLAGTTFAAMLRGLVKLVGKSGEKIDTSTLSLEEWTKAAQGASSASAKMSRIGSVEIVDATGQLLPIFEIIRRLENEFGKLTTIEVGEIYKELGEESAKGIQLLMGHSDALRQNAEQIRETAAMQAMFETRMEGVTAGGDKFINKWNAISIMIGDQLLPGFNSLIGVGNEILEWIRDFIKENPEGTKWIAWIGITTGLLLTMAGTIGAVVFGLRMLQAQAALIQLAKSAAVAQGATEALGSASVLASTKALIFATGAKIATAAQWLWNASVMGFPLVWIIVAIAAVVAAIVLLVQNWDTVIDAVISVGNTVWEFVKKYKKWLLLLLGPMGLLIFFWDEFKMGAEIAFNAIKSIIDDFINSAVVQGLLSFLETIGDFASEAFNFVFGGEPAPALSAPGIGNIPILGGPGIELPTPAEIAQPEIPATQIQDNSTFEINITPPAGTDSDEIARDVIKRVEEKKRLSKSGRM